jgi:hypothetical protein
MPKPDLSSFASLVHEMKECNNCLYSLSQVYTRRSNQENAKLAEICAKMAEAATQSCHNVGFATVSLHHNGMGVRLAIPSRAGYREPLAEVLFSHKETQELIEHLTELLTLLPTPSD